MKTIRLKLKENPYDIVIGEGILAQLGQKLKSLKLGPDVVIVTNPVVRRLHGKKLAQGLAKSGFQTKFFEVPDGEKSKSAEVAIRLMERIAQYDVYKKIVIVAFGGGVIGDLAGYVAAVYKRGVPYVQVPTTFLAQIDSAIGGKVAIDLPMGKNFVGAFYQPKVVWSDVALLKTLDKRQIRNGLAEAVKYGVIYKTNLFADLEKNYSKVLRADAKTLNAVVAECSRIKAEVVMADEKETKGIRTILNFGHTIGHAIEAAGKYARYHHGEAIALGMRVAAAISVKRGLFATKEAARLNGLLSSIGLPRKIQGVSINQILELMKHDKKFIAGKNRFVLATRIGQVKVVEGVSLALIRESVSEFMA